MIDYLSLVKKFHDKFGHHTSSYPKIPPIDVVILRRRLILEEANEVDDAMATGNLVEIADGIADLLYVTFGSALAFGIPIDDIYIEVQRSNMSKSTKVDKFGKSIKGPDWSPPNIKSILDKHKLVEPRTEKGSLD